MTTTLTREEVVHLLTVVRHADWARDQVERLLDRAPKELRTGNAWPYFTRKGLGFTVTGPKGSDYFTAREISDLMETEI